MPDKPDKSLNSVSRQRVIARFDLVFDFALPPRTARAARIAEWLRNLATVIEGGDSPTDRPVIAPALGVNNERS